MANFAGGCNHYCMGTDGFQMYGRTASASAEYTLRLGGLAIKPGAGYQYVQLRDHKPSYLDFNDGTGVHETSGFWGYYSQGNDRVSIKDMFGSLRLDYNNNGLRLIGALRMDKTSIPDQWNPAWQFVAAYEFNESNFLRLNYGRATRSAALVNTSSNYNWHNSSVPHWIQFLGNEDASLVNIDNFEVGYRWKPNSKLLIDAEAFYSISRDYGELKAYKSMLTLSSNDLTSVLTGLMTGQMTAADLNTKLPTMFGSKAYIRYDEMPFKVYQKGIGVNVDWIISPKLIAKVNANIQQTKIDNYYQYSQPNMIMQQLLKSKEVTLNNISPLIQTIMTNVQTESQKAAQQVIANGGTPADAQQAGYAAAQQYIGACIGYTPVNQYRDAFNALSDSQKEEYLANLEKMHQQGQMVDGNVRPLGLYYALKYNIEFNKETDEYYFGSSVAEQPKTQNNYKHTACPSFYGNIGLIYKPTDRLSFSSFGYFVSKRTLCTIFGTQDVDPFFTMNLKAGYKPVKQCEVFFEAHNLLNSNKRESAYTDKIKGTYTFGVTFGF